MKRINKLFNNLKRLNFKSKIIVLIYLIKKKIKIKPSILDKDVYYYYSQLVIFNGYVIEETYDYYVTVFKDNFEKTIKLRKRPSSDFSVFGQIYNHKEYLPVVNIYNANFKNNVNYKMNIIDAGANIGLTTLYFLENFDNTTIVCVEPEINNLKILEFNLSKIIDSNIIIINAGIWNSNAKLKIVNDFRDKSDWAFRVEETEDNNGIQAYTINHIVKINNFEYIDILKIDIEGSEKDVFKSINSNFDFLRITKCIAIEIHDEFNCRQEINDILTNYGFSYFEEGTSTIGINNDLISI
jgi:FkbM family methyltransferase